MSLRLAVSPLQSAYGVSQRNSKAGLCAWNGAVCHTDTSLPASDLGPAGVCVSAVALRDALWDLYPYLNLCVNVCIRMPHPRGAQVTTIHITRVLAGIFTPEAANNSNTSLKRPPLVPHLMPGPAWLPDLGQQE